MPDISDKETIQMAEKKIKKYNNEDDENDNKFNRPIKLIKSVFIEFNVIPYSIGFIIALSLRNLLSELSKYILKKIFNIKNPIVNSIFELILMIVFIYVFIVFVFYEFLYSSDIAKEKIFKTAIYEKKIDEAKKEIKKDPETKNIIENSISEENNSKIEEYYLNY